MNNSLASIAYKLVDLVVHDQKKSRRIDKNTNIILKQYINIFVSKGLVHKVDVNDLIKSALHILKTGKFPYTTDNSPAYSKPSNINSLSAYAPFTSAAAHGFDHIAYDMLYKSHE